MLIYNQNKEAFSFVLFNKLLVYWYKTILTLLYNEFLHVNENQFNSSVSQNGA